MPIEVRKVELTSVDDASGFAQLIDKDVFAADEVVAVIGKTEGNGGVNDYTRILADQAFRGVLKQKGSRSKDEVDQIPMAWSGGCDGVIAPHATVFAEVAADATVDTGDKRLSVGFALSDVLLPEDIGRPAMIEKVASGVERAMARAGISDAADVHYVQTKTPLLVQETIADAYARGKTVYTEDTLYSMDVSNGTTALGIALALGEIPQLPTSEQIGRDHDLYSTVASCSSGVELDRAQIVVVGNSAHAGSRYRVGHSQMHDAIDQNGIWDAIRDAGLDLPRRPHWTDLDGRVVNVFLKCEADPRGTLRGRRQLSRDDSDVHHHRQIKGAVGGVAAASLGDPAVFVSVGALHQGPLGGGPVAAIVRLGD
jgi:ring-opening amidohydrolase-like protein